MITTFEAKLDERTPLTEHVYLFKFTPSQPVPFQPGQYMIMHIPQADGHPGRRLYSMASAASRPEQLEFIVEILENGLASQHLMKMQIGEMLTMQGPAGMFTLAPSPSNTVFLATGTGVAPMRSMIYDLMEKNSQEQIYLFWGFPYVKEVYLLEEFKALAQAHPNFHFMNCLSREQDLSCVTDESSKTFFTMGHVNDGMEQMITNDLNTYHYYICGGPKVVESLREYLTGKNIDKERIHFEKFTV